MRIRSHLLLLVGGALLPLLLFASALTTYSWWQQRHAVEQRQLERVRAVTISIDTELQAIVRGAKSLALIPDLVEGDLENMAPRLERILGAQPLWSMLVLATPDGRTLRTMQRPGAAPMDFAIDPGMADEVRRTRGPAVSGLVHLPSGRYQTQVAVPVIDGDRLSMMVIVVVDPASWLAFMGQFPLATGSTLTLADQHGVIVARTLNNDAVIGKVPTADYQREVGKAAEGAYRARGMEGQQFLAAHSRSPRWGWTVATGLPVEAVNVALRDGSVALVLGAMISIGLAVLLAILFGRRIEGPIHQLGVSARRLARGEAALDHAPDDSTRIDEVERVAEAFAESARTLREREAAVQSALSREQDARREAEAASRAKDEFLAMLGHELRNPLNAIGNATAVLERSPKDEGMATRSRAIIGRQVKALRELVDDLLDVARVTSGKIVLARNPVELGVVARRAVASIDAAGRLSRHHVILEAPGQAWVEGDETRLEQIVTNLVDNAIKYTPDGGHVSVEVRAGEREACVIVEDDGMGIGPELLPRVFDLFSQGERTIDRSQGGLGLGLALVRRLAELHGGTARAESGGPGLGSAFTVSLPAIPRPADARPALQPAVGHEHKRILVVEDNPDGRETLVTVLEMQGHEVEGADSGPAGLAALRRFRPDLAIVDIGLPGFDGFELARRARAMAELARTRLVALTGYGQEDDRERARDAGFDVFLVKPADFGAISNIINQG